MSDKNRVLWHQSGVNVKGEPFVQLMLDDKVVGQFDPAECRDHARSILEAAEAAEQDAFLLQFFQKEFEVELQHAMKVLRKYREWREARGKKGPPSSKADFMVTPEHQQPPKEDGE